MRWKRKDQRREEAREQLLALAPEAEHESPENISLAELHSRTTGRSDVPTATLPGDKESEWAEQDRVMNDRMRQAEERRRPSRNRPEWLAWGRRHGTEHPEQTRDRAGRQQAQADAVRAQIDQRYAYRAEDQYDRRTIGNVARRGQEPRRLNAYRAGPPQYLGAPGYDYTPQAEQVTGDFYRREPGTSGRARHSDYAWNMRDGW